MPLHRSEDGKVIISLVEPSDKKDAPRGGGRARDDLDDEVPF